jgi:malonyl CoA-acyl carrier protein transacylase
MKMAKLLLDTKLTVAAGFSIGFVAADACGQTTSSNIPLKAHK